MAKRNNKNKPDPADETHGAIVQLQSNQAGHQAGETFIREDAGRLGILTHCRPFPGQNNRAVNPDDVTTR